MMYFYDKQALLLKKKKDIFFAPEYMELVMKSHAILL